MTDIKDQKSNPWLAAKPQCIGKYANTLCNLLGHQLLKDCFIHENILDTQTQSLPLPHISLSSIFFIAFHHFSESTAQNSSLSTNLKHLFSITDHTLFIKVIYNSHLHSFSALRTLTLKFKTIHTDIEPDRHITTAKQTLFKSFIWVLWAIPKTELLRKTAFTNSNFPT